MGRKVQIRASYQNDAGYLMRLATAVEMDPKQSPEWRTMVVGKIQELVVIFLTKDGIVPPTRAVAKPK